MLPPPVCLAAAPLAGSLRPVSRRALPHRHELRRFDLLEFGHVVVSPFVPDAVTVL
ncbi:MAG: hypothetical protein PVJ57_18435 [Phycisphaerae bacterium]